MERLAALHPEASSGGAVPPPHSHDEDDVGAYVTMSQWCQLCLGDDAQRSVRCPWRCEAGHGLCETCARRLGWTSTGGRTATRWGVGGCPACEVVDTDAGLQRLMCRGGRSDIRSVDVEAIPRGMPFLVRESFGIESGEGAAVAGVLVAERRATFAEMSRGADGTSSDGGDGWCWWDCGAQLEAITAALPPLSALPSAVRHPTSHLERAPGGDGGCGRVTEVDLAVVSNGSALLGARLGATIDAHRTVARFNAFECGGAYAADVGSRTDIHATGWLMSASRDVPGDRLGAEDGEPDAPALEVRLPPNAASLGRTYYAKYFRAIVHHHARHGRREDWWRRRRAVGEESDKDAVGEDDARAVGPVCVVLRPTTYGEHWRHVIDTAAGSEPEDGGERLGLHASRRQPRVTSGYLFLLTALDIAGHPLPGGLGEARVGARRSESLGSVTLYGFEDDARNATDGHGGHYFDALHRQQSELYDLPWERSVMRGLAASDGEKGGVRVVRVFGDAVR